jgi:Uma2 family endonuclease
MPVPTHATTSNPPVERSGREGAIPPLENGDRLSGADFLRRYEAMPHLRKAELIEGVVYVSSPVRHRYHGRQQTHLLNWLGHYEAGTPGVEVSDNSTVFLDQTNTPQPDCLMFIQPEHRGQVTIDENGYINGAPDLVAEVAASSVSYDLHDKFEAYRRNGVREYLIWRVLDQRIEWFVLIDGQYIPIVPAGDGALRSTIFPGLWLDHNALLRGDLATVLAVIQRGLDTLEHAAFKVHLQQAKAGLSI